MQQAFTFSDGVTLAYDPSQPRHPAGSSDGGRFAPKDGAGAAGVDGVDISAGDWQAAPWQIKHDGSKAVAAAFTDEERGDVDRVLSGLTVGSMADAPALAVAFGDAERWATNALGINRTDDLSLGAALAAASFARFANEAGPDVIPFDVRDKVTDAVGWWNEGGPVQPMLDAIYDASGITPSSGLVAELSSAWATSASSPLSLAAHEAAADVFELDNARRSMESYLPAGTVTDARNVNHWMQGALGTVVRSQARVSQQRLIDEFGADATVRLYRGVSADVDFEYATGVQTNPLASWSTLRGVASDFARYGEESPNGWIITAEVPVTDVVGISGVTGFGAAGEFEMIVAGEWRRWTDLSRRNPVDESEYDDDFDYAVDGSATMAFDPSQPRHPAGSTEGGRFAPKDGAGSGGVDAGDVAAGPEGAESWELKVDGALAVAAAFTDDDRANIERVLDGLKLGQSINDSPAMSAAFSDADSWARSMLGINRVDDLPLGAALTAAAFARYAENARIPYEMTQQVSDAVDSWNEGGPVQPMLDSIRAISDFTPVSAFVAEVSSAWASSSTSALALAAQIGAVREFGLDAALTSMNSYLPSGAMEYGQHVHHYMQGSFEAVVRAQAAVSQQRLRDEFGDAPIRLYRGVKPTRDLTSAEAVQSNPLSSWTTLPGVARDFSGTTGFVMTADVPIDDIVGIAGVTGLGAAGEWEMVVAGRERPLVDVARREDFQFAADGSTTMAFDPSQPRDENGRWTSTGGGGELQNVGPFRPLTSDDDVYEATSRWANPGTFGGGRVFDTEGNLPFVEMTRAADRAARGLPVRVTPDAELGVGLLLGMPDAPPIETPHYRGLTVDFNPDIGVPALASATPDLELAMGTYTPGRGAGALIRFEPGTPHREALAGSWGQITESIVSGKFEFTRTDDLTEREWELTTDLTTGESTPVYSARYVGPLTVDPNLETFAGETFTFTDGVTIPVEHTVGFDARPWVQIAVYDPDTGAHHSVADVALDVPFARIADALVGARVTVRHGDVVGSDVMVDALRAAGIDRIEMHDDVADFVAAVGGSDADREFPVALRDPHHGGITFRYDGTQPRHPAGTSEGGRFAPKDGTIGDAIRPLAEPDGGFTLDARDLSPMTTGFAVALSGTDRLTLAADAFGSDGKPTDEVVNMVRERITAAMLTPVPDGTEKAIGGWHNPGDSKVEVNVTVVFPADQRDAATAFAQAQDQIAMADLDAISRGDWDNAIIDTGGTGGDRTTDEFRFDPNQPRHPAGSTEGGRFAPTDGGGGGADHLSTTPPVGYTLMENTGTRRPVFYSEITRDYMIRTANGQTIATTGSPPDEVPTRVAGILEGVADAYDLSPGVPPPSVHFETDVPTYTQNEADQRIIDGSLAFVDVAGRQYDPNTIVVNSTPEGEWQWTVTSSAGPAEMTGRSTMMPAGQNPSLLPAYIGAHEYGHIRYALGVDDRRLVEQAFANIDGSGATYREWESMSAYARTNAVEAHAEAYAEWTITGGSTPNHFARQYARIFGWDRAAEMAVAAPVEMDDGPTIVMLADGPDGPVTVYSDGTVTHHRVAP